VDVRSKSPGGEELDGREQPVAGRRGAHVSGFCSSAPPSLRS
jgi:hypothetical protein